MKTRETAYIRAQASILRSSGISIQETSKILQRSERWVKKWSSREGFEANQEQEDRLLWAEPPKHLS